MKRDFCKIVVFMLSISMAASLAFAGGEKEVTPKETKPARLLFWKAPGAAKEEELWKPIIAKFEAENPGITIVHEVTPWDGWSEKYTTGFASDNPPDVSYMPDAFFPKYAEAGKLQSLDERGWTKEITANFPSSILKGSQYDLKQYGIPFYGTPHLMYWNKTLFADAGLSGPPKTMDDFTASAVKVTKGDVYGFGMPATAAQYNYVFFYTFLFSFGGQVVDEKMTKAIFNSTDSVAAIQYVSDLFNKYKVCPSAGAYNYDQLGDLLAQKKLAMFVFNSMLAQKLTDIDFGITTPPKGKTVGAFGDWGHIFIAKNSRNLEAAWKFAKFITDKWAVEQYVAVAKLPPARKDIGIFRSEPNIQVFLDNLSIFQSGPIHVKSYEINTTVAEAVEAAIMGGIPAKKAADDATMKINDLLAK